MGVQRSAKTSAARAIGQYCPYVRMPAVSPCRTDGPEHILSYRCAVGRYRL
jgi:hypothetical protein